jgi:hypothetical protein
MLRPKRRKNSVIDSASLEQLRREVEKIPPQTNPRAAKSLADLKAAVKRLEEGK